MDQDSPKLAGRLMGFINDLQAANVQWRMCITTTDTEYYNGRPLVWTGIGSHILTPNAPNLSQVFSQTFTDIGSGWSNDERGIYAMNQSVLNDSQGYNCYRPNAGLAVILLSDEDERSVGGTRSRNPVQYKALESLDYPASFVSSVNTRFNSGSFAKKLVVNSIIVKDKTCEKQQDKQGVPSFMGYMYQTLANLTQGFTGSICDSDYGDHLRFAKEHIVLSMEKLDLQCTPIENPSVKVSPSVPGLHISLEGKTLKFDPLLTENTQVTLSYKCLK
jgi:hypothetical protein